MSVDRIPKSRVIAYESWLSRCHADDQAKNGRITCGVLFRITPTGIADHIEASYPSLDRKIDLSDYDNW